MNQQHFDEIKQLEKTIEERLRKLNEQVRLAHLVSICWPRKLLLDAIGISWI